MDKRKEKTYYKIYFAFKELITEKVIMILLYKILLIVQI